MHDTASALLARDRLGFRRELIDIGLPGIDGYEVARQARAEHGQALLLIALTGYRQPADRQYALEAGFDVHLTRPSTIEGLCALLS